MLVRPKTLILTLVFTLAMLSGALVISLAQESQARLATSNGKGILKLGQEQFNVTAVIVKLLPDRQVEVTVVTDITVFLSGTWSTSGDQQGFDLQITGGASAGSANGTGKLVLSDDGKSIIRLTASGAARTSKRSFELNFEGQQ